MEGEEREDGSMKPSLPRLTNSYYYSSSLGLVGRNWWVLILWKRRMGDVIYDLILEALSLIDALMLQWARIGNGLIGAERIKVKGEEGRGREGGEGSG